jgi:hypothetical protein
MNLKKVKLIDEIMTAQETDSTFFDVEHISRICYAPHLGYRSWVFKYKSMYVLFFDEGNGHYQYLCPLSFVDVILAKIISKIEMRREK